MGQGHSKSPNAMDYTMEDLNPEEGQHLQMAEATLDAYTFLLKHELDIDVKGIPTQWLPI